MVHPNRGAKANGVSQTAKAIPSVNAQIDAMRLPELQMGGEKNATNSVPKL